MIDLVNRGHAVHIGSLVRLDDGKTVEDFESLLTDPNPPQTPPGWVHGVSFSGFSPLSPGRRAGLLADLESPGLDVYFCLLTNASDEPHAVAGEVTSFRVGGREADTVGPRPNAEIVSTDGGFRTPALTAGRQLLRLVNHGREHHELAIVQIHPGSTPAQVDAWLQGGQVGPAPATFYGGAQDVAPGGSTVLDVVLRRGRYLVVDGETGVTAPLIVRRPHDPTKGRGQLRRGGPLARSRCSGAAMTLDRCHAGRHDCGEQDERDRCGDDRNG
jgi:hypothetical protein